jgi:uncharacterized Zn finger protein
MEVRYELRCKKCGHDFIKKSEELIDEDIGKGEFTVKCPNCKTIGSEKDFIVLSQREI